MSGVALVTGANGGIGSALVAALVAEGWNVLAGVRDVERWSGAPELHGAVAVDLDVTAEGCVATALAAIDLSPGDVDLLVNNAGIAAMGTCEEVDMAAVHRVFDVNLFGAMACTQEVLPAMVERGRGVVVNVSSIAGVMASPGQVAYCASKRALEAYTECLFHEVHRFGVRVVLLEPGITPTPIFEKQVFPETTRYGTGYQQLMALVLRGLTSGAVPDDVAAVMVQAIGSDSAQLRYPCSWGAAEVLASWGRLTPEQAAEIASSDDADEYLALLEEHIGLPGPSAIAPA